MDAIDRHIAALLSDIDYHDGEANKLRRELRCANEEKYGVKVGDVVQAKTWHGDEYEEMLVTAVSFSAAFYKGKPSIHAKRKKKNGEWFERPQYIGSAWRKP